MLLLPIRTSIRPYRTPYVNYALIVVNIAVFLATYTWPSFTHAKSFLQPWAEHLKLNPAYPFVWQYVTYAFLHGGVLHILGNMYFLYLFGNNVNDKLGHLGYLSLYLAGAVFSAIGHSLLHSTPVVGASGAIAAVIGAYLALFPQTTITVFYWIFIFIGTIEISALFLIGIKLILLDNVIARVTPDVAYDAHLAGYGFGILTTVALLATGLVTTTSFDLWSMVKHWNRRRQYRDVIAAGYDPFSGRAKKIKVKEVKVSPAEQAKREKVHALREQIARRISERNMASAAESYLELAKLDSEQVLPRQYLLDIANQLASENRHEEAATAYEKFLKHYGNYEYVEEVELMLGLLYTRYLHQSELAIKHLEAAVEKLTDPGQLKMCKDEIERLKG